MKRLSLLLAALLAGCSSTAVSMTSQGFDLPIEAPPPQAASVIGTVNVSDQRGENPNYLGAIRGLFGTPVKTLTAAQPVQAEVAQAFIARLSAHGLYDPAGPDALTITLTDFDADQAGKREALVAFTLALSRGGQVLYQHEESVDKVNGSLLAIDSGVLGSTDALQALLEQAFSQAVDQALDRPEFLAAMRHG